MTRSHRLSLLAALALLALAPACGDDPAPSPYAPGELGLTPADASRVDAAAARYTALRATLDAPAARAALVAELAAAGLAPLLGDDGTSLRLTLPSGALAAIMTDEVAAAPLSSGLLPPARRAFALSAAPDALAGTPIDARAGECEVALQPESRPIALIGAASQTNPSVISALDALAAGFAAAGWTNDDDIVQHWRGFSDDRDVIPDTLLDLRGYGQVFILARAGRWTGHDGQPHTFVACCHGGNYSGVVSPERLAQYLAWQRDGLLTPTWVLAEDGRWVSEITLRDDLFARELDLDQDTVVAVSGRSSFALASAFRGAGGGALFGWHGAAPWDEVVPTLLALTDGLAQPGAESPREAHERVSAPGLDGEPAVASVNFAVDTFERDVYPWAWVDVSLDADVEVGEDADRLEVTLRYGDCPLDRFAFELAPGVPRRLEPALSSGESTFVLRVRSADGTLLASGTESYSLSAGAHEVSLGPCRSALDVSTTDAPPGTERVVVEVEYRSDPELEDPQPVEIPVDGEGAVPDLWSLDAVAHLTARGADDVVLARDVQPTALWCGSRRIWSCFAWLELSVAEAPAGAASVAFEILDGPSGRFAVGETHAVYGLAVDETVIVTARFLDAHGGEIATTGDAVTLDWCGAHSLELSAATYGLDLAADRVEIPADGATTATITATARKWRDGDVIAPSGDPVGGVDVLFHTDFGELVGPNPVRTDAAGVAAVRLRGRVRGDARVGAAVLDDGVEARREAVVRVGDPFEVTWFWNRTEHLTPGTTVGYELRLTEADGAPCAPPEGTDLEVELSAGRFGFWSVEAQTSVQAIRMRFSGCSSPHFQVKIPWNALGRDVVEGDIYAVDSAGRRTPYLHFSQALSTVSGPLTCLEPRYEVVVDPFICPPAEQDHGRTCRLVIDPDPVPIPSFARAYKLMWVDALAGGSGALIGDSTWNNTAGGEGAYLNPPQPTSYTSAAKVTYCATSPAPTPEEDEAAGCGAVAELGTRLLGCYLFSEQSRTVLDADWAP